MTTLLHIEQIMQLIPHRYPLLLIDRILDIEPQECTIMALKNVSINEQFFSGHFPLRPVMPGVLIIEAMAQAAVALVAYLSQTNVQDKLIYLMSIENAQFRRPVVPGDALIIHVKKVSSRSNIWKLKGEAKVEDEKVANATFSAILVDKQPKN